MKSELQRAPDPRAALQTALLAHFGATLDAETVVGVTLALVTDVHDQLDVDVSDDANALCRLAEAYLRSQAAFARREPAQIDLPFIGATPSGPVHYRRVLTLEELQRLVAARAQTSVRSPWWKFW